MTEINDLVDELADDVYVRGISPSQPFKPMTENELNIDQELTSDVLREIAGGPHFSDWSTAFAQRPFGVTRSNQPKGIKHPDYIIEHKSYHFS